MYAYLVKTRGLSVDVVNYFVHDLGILYQDERKNLVFVGKDKDGISRYAFLRGTADWYGVYRGDVKGSSKEYNVSIVNPESDEVKIFEASIDLMSYIDITGDRKSNYLVLGGCVDIALQQFLDDYSHVKRLVFCLDNDEAGKNAAEKYCSKYRAANYECSVELPEGKDYNEMLVARKGLEVGNNGKYRPRCTKR